MKTRIFAIVSCAIILLPAIMFAQTLSIARLSTDLMGLESIQTYQLNATTGMLEAPASIMKFHKKTVATKTDQMKIIVKRTASGSATTVSSVSSSNSAFTAAISDAALTLTDSAVVTISFTGTTAGVQNGTLTFTFNNGAYSIPVRGEIGAYLLGDVDLSNIITAADASAILQHVVGLSTLSGNGLSAADVSGTGGVTSLDASYVLQWIVQTGTGYTSVGTGTAVTKPVMAGNPTLELGTGKIDDSHLIIPVVINVSELLAMDFKVWFNSTALKFVEAQRPEILQNMMWVDNTEGDYLQFAAAGTEILKMDEAIIYLVFEIQDESRLEEELANIEEATINEVGVTLSGEEYTLGGSLPTVYSLSQNYPNPFNPSTTIKYTLPEAQSVNLSIFNILGQKVWEFRGNQAAGAHQILWDSKNMQGQLVASGVYIYKLEAGSFVQTRKMVLVR